MNAIQDTHIEFGRTADPPQYFEPDCIPGDWKAYPVAFKDPFQSADDVRVIVTANDYDGIAGGIPANTNPAVVGEAWAVSTTGFTLWGRNSDSNPGRAGFYYMAVEELGQPPPGVEPVDLRLGILQQKTFSEEGKSGDWDDWVARFSTPLAAGKELAALFTGCNVNVRDTTVPPAVGISRDIDIFKSDLAARNSASCRSGQCAFYYVAGVNQQSTKDPFWIDSGVADAQEFAPSCKIGTPNWIRSWEVYFSRPFLTPPVVLLTAKDADAAVVGLAQDVTTHGFTLFGLNSDCGGGTGWNAQFYWVAIGCRLGCG